MCVYCSDECKQQINERFAARLLPAGKNNRESQSRMKFQGFFLNRSIGVITPHTGGGRARERKGLEDNTIYYAGR